MGQRGSMSVLTWGLSSSSNQMAAGAGVKWRHNRADHLKCLFTHKFGTSAGMARIAGGWLSFSLSVSTQSSHVGSLGFLTAPCSQDSRISYMAAGFHLCEKSKKP